MHTRKQTLFTSLVLLAILVFVVFNSHSIANSTRILFTDTIAPSLKSFSSLFGWFKKIVPFESLREENRILREKIDILARHLEEAKALSYENQRLKALLNFKKTLSYGVVPAQVIGRDPSNWSNSLIIDKGLSGGIRQNKAVISTRGLVGRILEVGRWSAKVLLITDPNSKVGVFIERSGQGGMLIGRPDGACKMIYIALDSDVSPGDKVMTAGFGAVYPKGILVGEVVKVDREPGRLYKYAVIKTAQDMSKLEEVLCIR